jgi:hypothetical protein
MDKHLSSLAWSAVPLLGGMIANGALGAAGLEDESSLTWLKWGAYAGQYIALAVWFAWGPKPAFARVAEVAVFGFGWMVASWAGAWISQQKIAADFSWLQMFSVAPLALLFGSLPLFLMRDSYRLTSRMRSTSQTLYFELAGGGAVFGLLIAAFGAWYVRRVQIESDLTMIVFLPIVLGAIAAVVAPLLARGLLDEVIQPQFVVSVPFVAVALAVMISLMVAVPGPGAAPIYAIVGSALVALGLIGSLILAFSYWRSLGVRRVSGSGTQNKALQQNRGDVLRNG